MALDHARLVRERDVALTLQQSLLPERLPEVPGLTVAARYRPGRGGLVGGDWYDAVPLPDGGVGARDRRRRQPRRPRGQRDGPAAPRAAHATRSRAARPRELAERLASLVRDARAARDGDARLRHRSTPDARELRYVSAGHPPPLVVEDGERAFPGGRARRAARRAGPPALRRRRPASSRHDALIVLYTDGLVERRDQPIDDGLERLAAIAADGGLRPRDGLPAR